MLARREPRPPGRSFALPVALRTACPVRRCVGTFLAGAISFDAAYRAFAHSGTICPVWRCVGTSLERATVFDMADRAFAHSGTICRVQTVCLRVVTMFP